MSHAQTIRPRSSRRLTRTVSAVAVAALSIGGAVVATATPAPAAEATDYTRYVDPFVSTKGDTGSDLPGAQAPNGIVKVNPMTTPNRSHSGYDYGEDQIAGFTQTNLDGVGGSGAGGDILIVPTETDYDSRPSTGGYAHDFSHDDEEAEPGYYRVGLGSDSGTIDAEATSTTRTALQRFTFPDGAEPTVVFDLANNFTSRTDASLEVTALDDGRVALSGEFSGNFNGASYEMAYYAETQQAVERVRTWGADGALTEATQQRGTDTGAVLDFGDDVGESVELRVSISPVSAEQARGDQVAETAGADFDEVRRQAHDTWNARLATVDISSSDTSDPDGELIRLFYTHLYRMFALPMNATSTDGTYQGVDGAVHEAAGFTYYDGWSSWDDFRKYSVFAYIDPDMYRDMVQSLISLLADASAAGADDLFGVTHSVPTVRFERSAVIIADALSKGFTGFDRLEDAYPMLRDLTGYYTGEQLRSGYVADRPGDSAQLGYDQWALAIVADELGRTDDAAELREQARLPLEHLYREGAWTAEDGTDVALLTPRTSSGDWTDVDYERFEAANLYQGTLWQYNWYPAYDMAGLADAMGGDEATLLALKHMFGEDDPGNGKAMLHSNANEIDLQAPYLFNYVGEPSLTQKWARAIYTKETWNRYIATGSTNEAPSANGEFTPPVKRKVYSLDPAGFLPTMDNDAGTMSTMFVAAAVGLFPVTAGSSQYQVGSPFFERATISYADGKSFSVNADGVSADDFYVQSATLDGAEFGNTWVDYSRLVSGGELAFRMGDEASEWGADGEPAYSMSEDAEQPGDDGSYEVTAETRTIDADADGAVDGAVTLALGGGAEFAGPGGADLTDTGAATLKGLPDGVTGTVTVKDASHVTVAVSGTVMEGASFTVAFTDEAFAGGVTAGQVAGDGLSSRAPLRISVAEAERSELQKLVDEALLVRHGNYSVASYEAFAAARDRAAALLADPAATGAQLRSAQELLEAAIDGLTLDQGAYRVLEAEQSDDWSGGSLSNEAFQSGGNLGGVTTGSWVSYRGLDFAGAAPKRLLVRYSSSYPEAGQPSLIEAHAGDVSGPVVASADLPGRGSWANYTTIDAEVTDAETLMDAEQVTFEFTGPDGQQWVSNFDWFQFSSDGVSGPGAEPLTLTTTNVTATGNGEKDLNLGGGKFENVANGSWAEWADQDLGDGIDRITASYDKPESRAASDSHIEIRLGSRDGAPIADIPLEYTGAGWGTYRDATVEVDPGAFSGTQTIYASFASTTQDDGHPYVANVEGFTLEPAETAPVVIEAEAWAGNSGGGLKSETGDWSDGTVTNLGATYDGAWLDYGDVDFGSSGISELSVHYVHHSGRCGADSAIDVYLDEFDRGNPGTPYATVELPSTGSDWSHAGNAAIELPDELTGSHRVYVALRTTADAGHPFVANIDSLTFGAAAGDGGAEEPADTADLAAAIAETEHLEGDADRYNWIDFGVFIRELEAARDLRASGSTSQQRVDDQARSLRLAGGQLVPRVRLVLENLVVEADALENRRYTDETWSAVRDALSAGEDLLANADASDRELGDAGDALAAALDGLVVMDETVPSAPAAASAFVTDSAVTVEWTAPADDGGSEVTGYRVALDDGHTVTIDDATQRSAVFTWLDEGRRTAARVEAINEHGPSAATPWTATLTVGQSTPTEARQLASFDAPAASEPFDEGELNADYASDTWPETPNGDDWFTHTLRDFDDLGDDILGPNERLANGVDAAAVNDAKAVEINNAASKAQVGRAEIDAVGSPTETMADGFGSHLGELYLDALQGGELPKTETLFGMTTSGLDQVGPSKDHYGYLRPYVRLGLVGDGGRIYESGNSSYDGLSTNGSFPSGHTYSGYTSGTLLATLVPELAPQILARASEYGDNRIVLGFHYPLDVMGSRMVAQATIAHRWADDEFAHMLLEAHDEMESVLGEACRADGYGDTLVECAGDMYEGLDPVEAVDLYSDRMTYGFPQVGEPGQDVEIPAEAAALLTTAFPNLSDDQRTQILEQTAGDSGYALDMTDEGDASWQRVNLAKALTAEIEVAQDGEVTVVNYGDDTADSVAAAEGIEVANTEIDGFDSETRTYVVDWPAGVELPEVAATAAEGGEAHIETSSPGAPHEATRASLHAAAVSAAGPEHAITVTSANGEYSAEYTVALALTDDDHLPDGVGPDDDGSDDDGNGDDGDSSDEGNGGDDGSGGSSGGSGDGDSGSGGGISPTPGPGDAAHSDDDLAVTGGGALLWLILPGVLLIGFGAWTMKRRGARRTT